MRITDGKLNGNNIVVLETPQETVAAEWHTTLVQDNDMSEPEAAELVEHYMKDRFDLSDEFIQWLGKGTGN